MHVKTNLMGAEEVVEISQEQIFAFEPGIGGFDALRRYALLTEPNSAVEWLVSLDDPEVSFALLEPFLFRPDYAFELADRDAQALGMQEPADALVRCILTLSEEPEKITANLLAPLVLCRRTHLARQVILQDLDLPMRAPIFPLEAVDEADEADEGEQPLTASA